MSKPGPKRLWCDPGFGLAADPYAHLDRRLRRLGREGLSAESTSAAVQEALFDLMEANQVSDDDRAMWDRLRRADRRLIVDFLRYEFEELPVPSDPFWEPPLPRPAVDPLELTQMEVRPDRLQPVRASGPALPVGDAELAAVVARLPQPDVGRLDDGHKKELFRDGQ